MTDAERKLWYRLRQIPIADSHFRRQATIGPYFADFACHRLKIVIEIDGSQHGEPEGLVRDAERTAYLESRGYRVLRFWNTDVLRETDSVMESIFAAIVQATGTPHP